MANSTTMGTQISRGIRRRCPRCGRGKAFDSYFRMKTSCTECGYTFQREEGYWTGAMIVNIAVCEAWFLALFVIVIVATAPDVDWISLLAIALITNGLLPILFYPYSRTLWMALDLHFHPHEQEKL